MMLRAITSAYTLSLAPAHRAFERAIRDVAGTQTRALTELLEANADTAFGRAHRFAELARASDVRRAYRERVPVHAWDALAPWVDRAVRGEAHVLTREPVRLFERTSGSTSANKLVPFTPRFLHELGMATGPWLYDLFTAHPALFGGRQYWSISPVTRARETTPGGTPIGMEDDAEYFGPLARWAISKTMAVPSSVAREPNVDAWRIATARHLLAAEDLALISVWSPSFLVLLMRGIERALPDLLASLPTARTIAIRRALDRAGAFVGEALWPRLAVVSSWADGPAATPLAELRTLFPRTRIQPKGLLATEGVVSFPREGDHPADAPGTRAIAAVASHALDFVDLDTERTLGPEEVREGMSLTPILSTGGGLYRYRLGDVVRCVGRAHEAPLLSFEGRVDRTSDLAGEKLDARLVDRALERACRDSGLAPRFVMLAPRREGSEPPSYRLYVEADDASDAALDALAASLERILSEGAHYAYCRRLGQLGPLDVRRVHDGTSTYERGLLSRGVRAGDIKPTRLDTRTDWDRFFSG